MRTYAFALVVILFSACVSSSSAGAGGAGNTADATTATDSAAAQETAAGDAAVAADSVNPQDTSTVAGDSAQGADTGADVAAVTVCQVTATTKNKAGDKAADLCDVPTTVKGGQEFTANVKVNDFAGGGPVEGLVFKVSFIHVSMGHGGSKVPMVEEVGGGLYKVTALKPSMSGNWRLTLTAGSDAFAFDFKVN